MGARSDEIDTSIRTQTYTAARVERTFEVRFDTLISGLESLLGRMSPAVLQELGRSGPDEAREQLSKLVGTSGLAIFQVLDHGALVRVFTGRPARARTYVFGNALIAIEMTKLVPEVGLYVPLRMFVEETGPRRTRVTYDLPSLTLAQFGSAGVDEVARDLDDKVEKLLTDAAKSPV
jgi:uncharacterized protein (DUF302 family)